MATFEVRDGILHLKMSALEQLGSCHRPVEMPISEIENIEFLADPWTSSTMRGMRAPGTGIPYVIMLGTLRNFRGWKAFCAIYKRKPVTVITWKSGPFSQWIVTSNREDLPGSLIN